MYKSVLYGLFLLILTLPSAAVRASDAAEIATLRQDLQRLTERLAVLEARSDSTAASPRPATSAKAAPQAKPGWPDRIMLKGDLRYRHESIDEDTRAERIRQRVRARVGVVAKVSESAEVGVQLATGGDDPISANQTLGDAASTKPIGLDLAYFAFKPAAGNTIIGGKMKNPWYLAGKSSLIWDGDLNPEGLAWQYAGDRFFANVSGLWFDERKAAADAIMIGGQAGVATKLANGSKITAGVGFYDYGATKGRMPFYDDAGRGNTLDANGNYAYDFELLELFAEFGTTLGDMPFSVYADWVRNGAAGPNDTGTQYGAKLGKASAPGSWEFGYGYTDLEADAVVAMFTDSDLGGGGTAVSGHKLGLGYAIDKRIKAQLTYFISENGVGTASKRDYNRLQADINLKY